MRLRMPRKRQLPVDSKKTAQQQVERIFYFGEELSSLQSQNVLELETDQQRRVARFHDYQLDRLADAFDIDITRHVKQIGVFWGYLSAFMAIGIVGALCYVFFRHWGWMDTRNQIRLLTCLPCAGLLLTTLSSWLDKTTYFTKVCAFFTFCFFVLNLAGLGLIFNLFPAPKLLLAWAVFALLLAYGAESRFLLVTGLFCVAFFIAALMVHRDGSYWIYFVLRPETFFPAAIPIFLVSFIPQRWFAGFSATYRVFGLLLFFLPALVLCFWGRVSYLDMEPSRVASLYHGMGYGAGLVMLGVGVWRGWPEVVNTAMLGLLLFLWTSFYGWWWGTMQTQWFFFLMAITGVLYLILAYWLRVWAIHRRMEAVPYE